VIVVGIAALLWWMHERRRRRRRSTQLSTQDALARDLDGRTNRPHFLDTRYSRNHAAELARWEEGLDRCGDAPPPYQAKSEFTVASDSDRAVHDPAGGITMPLRTLSRDQVYRVHPPEYNDDLTDANLSTVQPTSHQ